MIAFSMPTLLEPGDNSFQATDELLPAVVRALVGMLLIRPEARLLHAHERSAARRKQRPNDDALQPQSVPAIRELLVGFDDQDFGIDYAVPLGHGCGAEIKPMAQDGLEVVFHQPLFNQRTLREGSPNFFRRVRQFYFDHK